MNTEGRTRMNPAVISPCGLNCSVCYAFLRTKNKCSGCRADGPKPAYCTRCVIINCSRLAPGKSGFCYECEIYPCKRMKQLDRRYRLKYNTSLISNLEYIKDHGIDAFITKDMERWICTSCGGTICIHTGVCNSCS